jgi:hypothetical protein
MAIARIHQIDPSVARWYHCMTRCVRRAFLLEEGATEQKKWIDDSFSEAIHFEREATTTARARLPESREPRSASSAMSRPRHSCPRLRPAGRRAKSVRGARST